MEAGDIPTGSGRDSLLRRHHTHDGVPAPQQNIVEDLPRDSQTSRPRRPRPTTEGTTTRSPAKRTISKYLKNGEAVTISIPMSPSGGNQDDSVSSLESTDSFANESSTSEEEVDMEFPEHYQKRRAPASPAPQNRHSRRRRARSSRFQQQHQPLQRPVSLDGASKAVSTSPLSKPQRQATLEPIKREPDQNGEPTLNPTTATRTTWEGALQRNFSNPELGSPNKPAPERTRVGGKKPSISKNTDLDKGSIHSLGHLERLGTSGSNHTATNDSIGSGNTSRWSAFSQGTGGTTLNTAQMEQISIVPRFPRRQKTGENMPSPFRQRKLRNSTGSSQHSSTSRGSAVAGIQQTGSLEETNSGRYSASPAQPKARPQLPNRQKSFGKAYSLDQAVIELSKRNLQTGNDSSNDNSGDNTSGCESHSQRTPILNRQISPMSAGAPHKPSRAKSITGDDALYRQKSEPNMSNQRRKLPQRSLNNTSLSVTMHGMRLSERSLMRDQRKSSPSESRDFAVAAKDASVTAKASTNPILKSKVVYDTPRWLSTPPVYTNRGSRRTDKHNIRRVKSDGWKIKMPPRMARTLDASTQSQTTSDDSSRMPDSSGSGRFDLSGMTMPIMPQRQRSTSVPMQPLEHHRQRGMTDGSMADISNQTGLSDFSLDSYILPQQQQQQQQPTTPDRLPPLRHASESVGLKLVNPTSPRRATSDGNDGSNSTPKIPRRQVSDDSAMPTEAMLPFSQLSIFDENNSKTSPSEKPATSPGTKDSIVSNINQELNNSMRMPNKPVRQGSCEADYITKTQRPDEGAVVAGAIGQEKIDVLDYSTLMPPTMPQRQISGDAVFISTFSRRSIGFPASDDDKGPSTEVSAKPITRLQQDAESTNILHVAVPGTLDDCIDRSSTHLPAIPRRQESNNDEHPASQLNKVPALIEKVLNVGSSGNDVEIQSKQEVNSTPATETSKNSQNKGETQFLESRALRKGKRPRSNQAQLINDNRGNALSLFRDRFQHEVYLWQQQLDGLLAGGSEEVDQDETKQQDGLVTERRTKIKATLSKLQSDLDSLRKHSLSSSSSGGAPEFNDWDLPEDIPPTELGLLHTSLTKCATQLEQARDTLLPKGKFVFHRYRQARKLEEAQPSKQVDNIMKNVSPPMKVRATVLNKGPLEDLQHCSVRVSTLGEICTHYNHDDEPEDKKIPQLSVAGESSLVIRNVHHSSILLHYGVKEVHVSNVSNSEIFVEANALAGAMHVTKCRDVKIACRSFHQLRIHESSDLSFSIHDAKSSGGIILEDCSNLTFMVKASSNGIPNGDGAADDRALLDVKDFNWLRNGTPSPNFVIKAERDAPPVEKSSVAQAIYAATVPKPKENSKEMISIDATIVSEESDEDEL